MLEELNDSEGNKMTDEMFTVQISARQIMQYYFFSLIHILWELFLNVFFLLCWLWLYLIEYTTLRKHLYLFSSLNLLIYFIEYVLFICTYSPNMK